jgi:hypothetical protein
MSMRAQQRRSNASLAARTLPGRGCHHAVTAHVLHRAVCRGMDAPISRIEDPHWATQLGAMPHRSASSLHDGPSSWHIWWEGHEFGRRRSRLGGQDGTDDTGSVAAVRGAVCLVDRIIQVLRLDKARLFVDAAGPNPRLVAGLGAAEPGGGALVDGADVEVVTGVRSIPSRRRDARCSSSAAPIVLCSSLVQHGHEPVSVGDACGGWWSPPTTRVRTRPEAGQRSHAPSGPCVSAAPYQA